MAKTTIQAGSFKSRGDLENQVRNRYGLTPEQKVGVVISGTRAELKALQLDDQSIFWGIICEITDSPTELKPEQTKVDRGEETGFGINGRTKKKPQ